MPRSLQESSPISHRFPGKWTQAKAQKRARGQAVLDRVEAIAILYHAASPVIHIHMRSAAPSSSATLKVPNPTNLEPRESFNIAGEERVLVGYRG